MGDIHDSWLGLYGSEGKYLSCRFLRKDGSSGSRSGGWIGDGKCIMEFDVGSLVSVGGIPVFDVVSFVSVGNIMAFEGGCRLAVEEASTSTGCDGASCSDCGATAKPCFVLNDVKSVGTCGMLGWVAESASLFSIAEEGLVEVCSKCMSCSLLPSLRFDLMSSFCSKSGLRLVMRS